MHACTFSQPFATAALTVKDVDNRKAAPPRKLVGQRFAVHAGKKFDHKDQWGLHALVSQAFEQRGIKGGFEGLPTSAIVGTVLLKGFVIERARDEWQASGLSANEVEETLRSPWRVACAKCLWVLTDPIVLAEPIPMRGSQGWWFVPERYLTALEAA